MSIRHLAFLAVAVALAASPVQGGTSHVTADDPTWRAECGGCHTAFPPSLLSASAWRQVMASLDRHYGTDATLDAGRTSTIAAFLERNAGIAPRAAPPVAPGAKDLPRLADAAWFAREHRKVDAATIARSDVRSLVNCAACHPAADRGDFSERALRVPR